MKLDPSLGPLIREALRARGVYPDTWASFAYCATRIEMPLDADEAVYLRAFDETIAAVPGFIARVDHPTEPGWIVLVGTTLAACEAMQRAVDARFGSPPSPPAAFI